MSRKAAPSRRAKPRVKPESFSAPSDPDEALAALARTLDFAAPGRFLLAFAKCNLPVQRRTLVERLKVMLEPLNVTLLEVNLTERVTQLLPHLREQLNSTYLTTTTAFELEAEPALAVRERAGKLALFVYGLEHSLPSSDPKPPLLDHLNFSRELFRRDVPYPLVIWLPDYALTKVARGAPDFWAWRSDVFEFPPEPEIAQRVMRETMAEPLHVTDSLSVEAKRERLHLLARLLEDYRELGDGRHERGTRADILASMSRVHFDLGEWTESRRAIEQALQLTRDLDNKQDIAGLLQNLAIIAQDTGDLAEALSLYEQSLQLNRELGNKQSIASTLHNLGTIAQYTGKLIEARHLYEQSLQIKRELNNKRGVAQTLHNLGTLAYDTDDLTEARRLYGDSLQIMRELGDKQGIASILHNLGIMAQDTGDLAEARRLYEESLQIKHELGDKQGIASSLHQLGRLAEDEGHLVKALQLFEESSKMFNDLQSSDAEITQESIVRVKEQLEEQGNG